MQGTRASRAYDAAMKHAEAEKQAEVAATRRQVQDEMIAEHNVERNVWEEDKAAELSAVRRLAESKLGGARGGARTAEWRKRPSLRDHNTESGRAALARDGRGGGPARGELRGAHCRRSAPRGARLGAQRGGGRGKAALSAAQRAAELDKESSLAARSARRRRSWRRS